MVLVVILISSCVILCSIDYLSIMDSYLFIVLLFLFQLIMIIFVLSNDFIITATILVNLIHFTLCFQIQPKTLFLNLS